MNILEKKVLADISGARIVQMKINSADIARKAQPGQFIVLMANEEGERIPLTIVDADKASGTITIIFQEAGFTTKLLGKLNVDDLLYACVGPLGRATEIKNYGKVIVIGGGVGIAEVYPVAKALKAVGNHITSIIGSRSKDLLILEKELKAVSDELHIATDDGSYARRGLVTDILKDLLTKYEMRNTKYGLVYAVGPILMMKAVAATTKPFGIKTIVSMNAIMVDGTGMCGSCRLSVAGKVQFACVDGPEFDAQAIDWDEFTKRSRIYDDKEKHICKLKSL